MISGRAIHPLLLPILIRRISFRGHHRHSPLRCLSLGDKQLLLVRLARLVLYHSIWIYRNKITCQSLCKPSNKSLGPTDCGKHLVPLLFQTVTGESRGESCSDWSVHNTQHTLSYLSRHWALHPNLGSNCSHRGSGLRSIMAGKSSEGPKHSNRLSLERSPYLRQHATNPVQW